MTDDDSVQPVDTIPDFEAMDVSQTGNNRFTVTNRAERTITEVRLSDQPDCNCEDFVYNTPDDRDACKHILAANHVANQTIQAEEYALEQVAHNQREIRESVIQQERLLARIENAAPADNETQAAEPDAVEADTESADDSTPEEVKKVYAWLDERGVDAEKVRVWMDDDEVMIESQEQLADDEFAVLRDTDEIWYNGEQNYITEDNLREVLS